MARQRRALLLRVASGWCAKGALYPKKSYQKSLIVRNILRRSILCEVPHFRPPCERQDGAGEGPRMAVDERHRLQRRPAGERLRARPRPDREDAVSGGNRRAADASFPRRTLDRRKNWGQDIGDMARGRHARLGKLSHYANDFHSGLSAWFKTVGDVLSCTEVGYGALNHVGLLTQNPTVFLGLMAFLLIDYFFELFVIVVVAMFELGAIKEM